MFYRPFYNKYFTRHYHDFKDHGAEPFVFDITRATNYNENYRTALWTGKHLQLTLMTIDVGESIGLEEHPHLDQFIRIEQGHGLVVMGKDKENLDYKREVHSGYAIIISAGYWHDLHNIGHMPIKLYSIYAPPAHPHGTIHRTKYEAEKDMH